MAGPPPDWAEDWSSLEDAVYDDAPDLPGPGRLRLLVTLDYAGPFERIANRLQLADPVTGSAIRDVPVRELRGWLARRAWQLNRMWVNWHVIRCAATDRMPPDRWRLEDGDRENPVQPWSSYGRDVSW
jgi:hypothetical protein